jgi:nucleotide-binding universal stress UspA family protein
MKNINRILFPVDLTEKSEKLVPHALTMVQKFDAQLYVLFVVRVFQYFTGINVPPMSIHLFENELLENARRKMEEFKNSHFGHMSACTTEVILGEPAESIVGYIEDQRIDMVVMGTHGRKGLDRVLFGSVAERVIKTSPVPVLVVNPFKAE